MKTNLTIFLLLLSVLTLAPSMSNAQTKANANASEPLPNRIKVAYGDASYVSFSAALFGSLLGPGDLTTLGSFSAGYRRLTNNARWAFGGDLNYIGVSEKHDSGIDISYNFFAVLPTVECYYLKSGICRLYGTAAAGPVFGSGGSSGVAFQVSPIAVRLGNNRIAGFVELGVGFKGVANFGLEVGF